MCSCSLACPLTCQYVWKDAHGPGPRSTDRKSARLILEGSSESREPQARDANEKKTAAAKAESMQYKQSKQYLRPLLKSMSQPRTPGE